MPTCLPFGIKAAKRFAAAIAFVASVVTITAANAASINIEVDEAKLIQLNRPISQVIIGNPAIADVTVQSRQTLVFTGKSAGHTNVILLDENNNQVLNEKVHVVTSSTPGLVILHRGMKRNSYHCGTICNARVTFGDDLKFTQDTLKNTESKLQFSRDAANGNR